MGKAELCIVTVLLLSVIAASAVYFVDGNGGEDDTTGYWYQVGYYGFLEDDYGESRIADDVGGRFDITIGESKDGLFRGSYMGYEMTGVLSGDRIWFYGVYDTIKVMFYGVFEGDMMYGSTTNVHDDGSIGAFYTVYSKDSSIVTIPMDVPDITDDWLVKEAFAFSDGDKYEIKGNYLTVTDQRGPVFRGNMMQDVGTELTAVDVNGVFVKEKTGDCYQAYILDSEGENWNALINDKMMLLQTTLVDEESYTSDIMSGSRLYIRDGIVDTDVPIDVPDLAGTSWYASESNVAYAQKDITTEECDFTVVIIDQIGRLFTGEIFVGDVAYNLSGYVYDNGRLSFTAMSTDNVIHGDGYIRGDSIRLFITFDSSIDDYNTALYYLALS